MTASPCSAASVTQAPQSAKAERLVQRQRGGDHTDHGHDMVPIVATDAGRRSMLRTRKMETSSR